MYILSSEIYLLTIESIPTGSVETHCLIVECLMVCGHREYSDWHCQIVECPMRVYVQKTDLFITALMCGTDFNIYLLKDGKFLLESVLLANG